MIRGLQIFCLRRAVYRKVLFLWNRKISLQRFYLKNGQAVRGIEDHTPLADVIELAKLYNDNGIDKIIIFDLSDDDEEHEKNIHTIKNINRNVEIKTCAGGNINRLEDIKKFIYAGCLQVIVNGAKANSIELAEEASKRFRKRPDPRVGGECGLCVQTSGEDG